MKTPKKLNLLMLCIVVLFTSMSNKSFAQQYNLNNSKSELKVYGTSSLHDWHIVTEEQKGYLIIEGTNNPAIKKMKIEAVSKSLKSGKKGMDKNTYKSLDTDKYKTITFQFTEAKNVTKINDKNYQIETYGNLTVAGVTKKTALNFTLTFANNEVCLTGEKTMKMTEFNIDPPTALLGTITTGDDITIKFNTILKQ